MKFQNLFLTAAALTYPALVSAADDRNVEISIYNNDLALVKDTRSIDLAKGENQIDFEGVAVRLKPESVMIDGKGIRVLEQNYNYNLITPYNILEKSVGKDVKTVQTNPKTGENVFDTAKIVSIDTGVPVLRFSYGIETAYSGRLVFDEIPQGLQSKPTLAAKIYSTDAGLKDLSLAYLTTGISWKANYVAYIKDQNRLDLTSWVAVNNQSGIDYPNAKVQLVAGDVNQVSVAPRRIMAKAVMALDSANAGATDSAEVALEQISGYQLYTLDQRTDLKDNQNKQISLFERSDAAYRKEGRLQSSLYFNGENKAEFNKAHPQLYYVLNNTEADNLGLPLPAGVIRFYENDQKGRLQFIGEDTIRHMAKDEKADLHLGSLFNVFANGKITDIQKISEKQTALQNSCRRFNVVRQYTVSVEITNSGETDENIVFAQNIGRNAAIIRSNPAGKSANATKYEWTQVVPAGQTLNLDYVVRTTDDERRCD
jgi:hypothetical protein